MPEPHHWQGSCCVECEADISWCDNAPVKEKPVGKHHLPIVIYDNDGARHVVGEADVDVSPISQEMEIVGKFTSEAHKRFLDDERASYSIDWGKYDGG